MPASPQLPLTFLYGTHVPRCTHHVYKHFDDYFTLQYMHTGSVSLTIDDQHYALRGQWFWSCYPGPLIHFHAQAPSKNWNHRYLAFRAKPATASLPSALPASLLQRWKSENLFPLLPQRSRKPELAAKLFDDLLALAKRRDRLGRLRAINALESLLLQLAEARTLAVPSAQRAESPWLSSALRTLDSLVEPPSPDSLPNYPQLADAAGMSTTHFRRRFKQLVGVAPHHYLLHQRVDLAKRLLAETDIPIKRIADRLGYRDVFFFTRQFRALAGEPPATYRRSVQG